MRSLGKIFGIIISLWIIASFSTSTYARSKKSTQPLSINGTQHLVATINNAISSIDPRLNIGVAVKSMKYGDVLYAHNIHRPFVPASILKILTAESALLLLGSDYKFQTNFYTDASSLNNGVLYGNLYLVHSGDPTLTYYDLIDLMDILKAQNITQVVGNVFIDTTAYDQVVYGPGWIWKDTRFCYAAPISASIINRNCLQFSVAPGKLPGKLANIVGSPHHYYSGFQNSVVTKASRSRSCGIRLGTNADSSISVSGCMPKGHRSQGVSTVVSNVVEYNKSLVRTLFYRSGIQINGDVTVGTAPPNLPVVASHQSKPLSTMLTEMLKKSDNIIAGSIFKKLGETYTKQPGSWENGSMAVSHVLAGKAGVNTTNMNVLDGSGLSRYNQVTPGQMLQVLDYAYHDRSTNYEFINGLPIAGIDGTLKHRLRNVAGRVRAKTGTMSGVNSLAGYAISRDQEPLAFVIIVNGQQGMGWKYKELEDRITTALARYSR